MRKIFSVIIFFVCINMVYVSNIYAQDNTTIPQERPNREKRAMTVHRTGLGLIGVGVLLQITGILVGIEANRYYIEAYDSHAKWQRTNSVPDATKFNNLSEVYIAFAISSASVFGSGFLITLAGSILVATASSKISDTSNANAQSSQSASFTQSFSHVPVLSNNVYLFNYGYQLGIKIR